jgi:hypothetical protein
MIWGAASFLHPSLLAGLFVLPVIWWLLRFTPPRPRRVVFPPTRLLAGLQPEERTPAHSPWWLTALRMLVATLIIFALADPIMNTGAMDSAKARPTLLVVDNGWTAGSRWRLRQDMIEAMVRRAESQGQTITLALTAGLPHAWTPEPLDPGKARRKAASLDPVPYPSDHHALQEALDHAFPRPAEGKFNVTWLSDGVDYGAAQGLAATLKRLGADGSFTVVTDSTSAAPLGLYAAFTANHELGARVVRTAGAARSGVVQALSNRGARLGEVAFTFAPDAAATDANIPMPLELRNQVSRLEISGEGSAGAVYLLDARSMWRRVGVISGESREGAQPLLSPTHYIEKALAPYSEIQLSKTKNMDSAAEEQLLRNPSVLVLANIGVLVGDAGSRIKKWVEKGGMLIRFAGPRLEKGGDALLPVPLREGGRTLGGALSWQTPQHLAPFEKASPYYGLNIPTDVQVNRQVLAEPGEQQYSAQIWARLEDGTPLVTATRRGDGHVVLFHITANSDWSSLPLSGLFVDMLKRTVELANTASEAVKSDKTQADAKAGDAAEETSAVSSSFLAPLQTLDGFGRLGSPPLTVGALPRDHINAVRPGPLTPPGLYGPPGNSRALNIMTANSTLKALDVTATGAKAAGYNAQKPLLLAPWLWASAFALFAIDALVALVVMSGAAFMHRQRKGVTSALVLAAAFAVLAAASADVRAQPSRSAAKGGSASSQTSGGGQPHQPDAEQFALDASLKTRLAYVVTGDAAIDEVSKAGLAGLSRVLTNRTAVEPGEPMAVQIDHDELSFFPLLYWPVRPDAAALPDAVLAKVDAYMKQGGMIIFDTRDYQSNLSDGGSAPTSPGLANLIGKLDIPRIEPIPERHVLTKAFYLLHNFPGRWDGGQLWVEAQAEADEDGEARHALKSDGVSAIIVTSNDLAGAWAVDDANHSLYAAVPGGEFQREMAYRVGVNIVMYALTGNYKADQVHVPALLERLGQ